MTVLEKKRYATFVVAFLFTLGFNFSVYAQTQAQIYELASKGKTSELIKLKEKGQNLDVTNARGKTAICMAIEENNQKAYKTLKKAGANLQPKCVRAIPGDKYNRFLASYSEETSFWSSWKPYALGVLATVGIVSASSSDGGSDNDNIPGGGY